jgi:hypothetical protein
VTARVLAVTWVAVALLFIVLLGFELSKWRSLTTEMVSAASERQRLVSEIQLKEQLLVAEMRKHSALLQEMQWTLASPDPSAFLTRMADLAREKRMTILAVGDLERQSMPQFTKSWHAIQVRAPYREIRELAARVEQDRGILEDVRVEAAPATAGQSPGSRSAPAADEVQARFKLAALELSPQAKVIIERTLAASGGVGKVAPGSPLALPVPSAATTAPAGRDPFAFLTPPPRVAGGQATTGPGAPGPPASGPQLELKGIVSFPNGFLAIVNNQIVKVGDTVSGHRVERITEHAVTLREPGATTPRTIELPEIAPAAPAAPRR